MQDIYHCPGWIGWGQQMRNAGQHGAQAPCSQRGHGGKISSQGSRPTSLHPGARPAQVTSYVLGLAEPACLLQMLDQVIPHIPVSTVEFPPRNPRQAGGGARAGSGGREGSGHCVHQRLVEAGQPLLPLQLPTQEIADHVMQHYPVASVCRGGHQGQLGQLAEQPGGLQFVEAAGFLPQPGSEGDGIVSSRANTLSSEKRSASGS